MVHDVFLATLAPADHEVTLITTMEEDPTATRRVYRFRQTSISTWRVWCARWDGLMWQFSATEVRDEETDARVFARGYLESQPTFCGRLCVYHSREREFVSLTSGGTPPVVYLRPAK